MDFNELRRKATEAASVLADKSLVLAKKAADKTKDVARITKLKTEIAAERESIRKNYMELGKMYYEKYKDDPADNMAQAVSEITVSLELIAAKQAEIDELKAEDVVEDDTDEETVKADESDFADTEEEVKEESAE